VELCWSQDCKALITRKAELCWSQDCRAYIQKNAERCWSNDCAAYLTLKTRPSLVEFVHLVQKLYSPGQL
jgi:hypothetical protein